MGIKAKIHELKVWPEYFEAALLRRMMFSLRKYDRDYEVGDIVVLHEFFVQPGDRKKSVEISISDGSFNPHPAGSYTGRALARKITIIMQGPVLGLAEGWVILGLEG